MGGGDLNSKKSWHPNTMKNQERVWKAEQAAAEEKKKMLELQRERAEERDRAELNSLMKHTNSSSADDKRLSWMYDKPDKKVDQEAYLLGKSIDKNAEISDKQEQDVIPAVSRRVVGSSMLTAAGDAQVDMSRKIREDPLLLIKERERAARAALLNNPLQRRRLAELLRKEQDLRKESKSKKSPKKKDKNLDDLLAAKLNALGGQKSLDLATLLDSDDSSCESSPDRKKQSKKKKKAKHSKKKKKKKSKYASESSSEGESKHKSKKTRSDDPKSSKQSPEHQDNKSESRKRKSSEDDNKSDNEVLHKKYKKASTETHVPKRSYETEYKGPRRYNDEKNYSGGNHSRSQYGRYYDDESRNKPQNKKRGGMTEDEKAARLAEMAAAGAEREVQRGRRVAEQRAADAAADRTAHAPRSAHNAARALPDSLESRIHSNRHYIQRDKRHMNEHFARR